MSGDYCNLTCSAVSIYFAYIVAYYSTLVVCVSFNPEFVVNGQLLLFYCKLGKMNTNQTERVGCTFYREMNAKDADLSCC